MFDQLFSCPRAVQRYLSAPLLEPRLRFLRHCEAQGATTATLRNIAFYQCAISRSIDLQSAGTFRVEQIREGANQWTSRTPTHHAQKNGEAAKVAFMSVAIGWLSYLGRVEKPHTPECPGARFITEYADYMRSERGLSPLTIYTRCKRLEEFLGRCCPTDRPALRHVTIAQIDQAIAQKGTQDGCTRTSIRTYAYILRSFFRYAETRGWCAPGLAAGILPPRVCTGERLPAGPTWEDVQRLCADAEGGGRAQIRDRAILLLFAVYGWRAGEVRRLRLEDLDWDAEVIRVTRSKQLRMQSYPLVRTVGDAILRYLKTTRPRCAARQVFLSLKAPIRPLGNGALWQIVSRRLRPFGLGLAHDGPHALRHACATRLLNTTLSD